MKTKIREKKNIIYQYVRNHLFRLKDDEKKM